MIEFNFILKTAQKPISAMRFWKLLIGTMAMLTFGYLGETGTLNKFVGFTGDWQDLLRTRSMVVHMLCCGPLRPESCVENPPPLTDFKGNLSNRA